MTILGCLAIGLSACSSQRNTTNAAEPDSSYLEWKEEAEATLGNQSYGFPGYDAEAGPLELIYDPDVSEFAFELYRSPEYRISKELSGVRSVHDPYYSYQLLNEEPDEAEILSGYNLQAPLERKQVNEELAILNDNISEYKEGNIFVYEIDEEVKDVGNSKQIVEFLKSRNIYSGKVVLVRLEGRLNLEFYLPAASGTAFIRFTAEDLDKAADFLSSLP